jgi:hypothetical protein
MNCDTYYSVPDILPPLGKSDHNIVWLTSAYMAKQPVGYRTSLRRHLNFNTINNIAKELAKVRWQELYFINNCQKQTNLFYTILFEIINKHALLHLVKIRNNDKPWITEYFKQLISRRDEAYRASHTVYYKKLRNQVNHVRKRLKTQYYLDQVQHLKSANPRYWWQYVKQLSGSINSKQSDCFANLTRNDNQVEPELLSEVVNDFFVSVSSNIP